MYIRSLRMGGFKSFADPTILEFEPGVNVIVGPNGSGKSNIADALSWVLGSQAPSSLRGGSMEDVIFAGSQDRPRLGTAEVELTLDNSNRVLPLDLNEVTVSRITDRAGNSEYRINGAPCRLLDVAELLSDTGIGRSIHTVVGQGQLDAVLQAHPEDRRAFIEEAAQIGKYRRRKDRSLRKIERVDDNLTRLSDVLSELRRAIRPLKRQASAAAAYSELMSEHQTLRQRLAATEIHRLATDTRGDPAEESQRARLLDDELASVRARMESAGTERHTLAEAAVAAREIAHRMARAVDRLDGLRRLALERGEKIAARLAAETEEGYRERARLLEGDRARWTERLTALEAESTRAATFAQGKGDSVDEARRVREEAEGRLTGSRALELAAAQALVRAEGSEAAGRTTISSIEARIDAVLERREATRHEAEDDAARLSQAESEVKTLEAELDAKTESASGAEARLVSATSRADELARALGASHADLAAAAARLEVLREVAELLAEHAEVTGKLQPLLAEATERARLAEAGEEKAKSLLADAAAEVDRRRREVESHDEELRRLDALMAGAAERLSGRRRKREQRETELAALDEELARVRESLAAAQRAAAEESASLPARRAAVEEASAARQDLEAAVAQARRSESDATSAATSAQMDARAAEERTLAARLRLEEAEAGIADAERALAGLEDLRASLSAARERAETVAEVARLAAERGAGWVERSDAQAETARESAESGERRLVQLRNRERELAANLEEVVRRRNAAEVRRAENTTRIHAVIERSMDEWGLLREDLERLELLDESDEVEARSRVDKLEKEMRRVGPVNPRAAEEYSQLAEREQFLVEQIEDLKSSRRDLMKVVREVDQTIVEVFGQAFEAVAREFEAVFARLFPGGSGRLKLEDPSNLLSTGIEVEARPPGKNVRKLSLLSGGERSLVALTFLFAIFRATPSPFYLLDEVEAALDDINLQRFLDLIHELEAHAQVLIVTHQKRTMEAADVLYGVSMGKEGTSRVVAKRMEEYERSRA